MDRAESIEIEAQDVRAELELLREDLRERDDQLIETTALLQERNSEMARLRAEHLAFIDDQARALERLRDEHQAENTALAETLAGRDVALQAEAEAHREACRRWDSDKQDLLKGWESERAGPTTTH